MYSYQKHSRLKMLCAAILASQTVFIGLTFAATMTSDPKTGGSPTVIRRPFIPLLEPIAGQNAVDNTGLFGAFGNYFALFYPWLVGTATGIAVLWLLIEGIRIMTAGSSSSAMDEAKKRFIQVLIGLLMIIFSAVILHFLNPTFFR